MLAIGTALFLLCGFQTSQPSPTPASTPAIFPFHWFHDVVTSAGFQWVAMAVGVFGAVFALYTWLDSKKKERVLNHLFKIAEQSLDKEDTEKELAVRRQEVKEASSRIEALQKKIEREIPLEAKRTVLKDRLNMNIAALYRELQSAQGLKKELEALGQTADIPADLMKNVENEISPEYVKAAKRESLKTTLTIIMTASAVLGSVLPIYELRSLIQTPLLLFGGTILLLLVRESLPSRGTKQYRTIMLFIRVGTAIFGCIVSGFFGMVTYMNWKDANRLGLWLSLGISVITLLATLIVEFVMWRKQRVISPKPVEQKHEEGAAAKGQG